MFPIQSKVPTLTFVGDPVHLRGLNDCLELSSHSQYRSPYMQEQYLLRDRLGSMVAFNSSHRAEYGLLHRGRVTATVYQPRAILILHFQMIPE